MDCTTTGTADPMGTPPTVVVTVCRRAPNFTMLFLAGLSKAIALLGFMG
jgi:hypothetical protein